MRANRILDVWKRGGIVANGWLHNPSTYSAELMAHQGYDCLTVDLQHGMIDFQTAFVMLQAISTTDATPIVRVPSHDPAMMMKLLDAGSFGVICPFVNDRAECERFVGACHYPPRGTRSNGAHRAALYAGSDYMDHADDVIVTLAMIETREGVENLDEILSVEGLSGLFVGPTDLAFSFGKPPVLDAVDSEVVAAIDHIVATAKRFGKHVGTVCSGGEAGCRLAARGFDFICPGTETALLARAAKTELARLKDR